MYHATSMADTNIDAIKKQKKAEYDRQYRLIVEWHEGELADVPSFTVFKTQICVTCPLLCVKDVDRLHQNIWTLSIFVVNM